MKYKHIIAVMILGVLAYSFGVWAKILHKPFANNFITTGFGIGALGLILLLIKVLTSKGRLNK